MSNLAARIDELRQLGPKFAPAGALELCTFLTLDEKNLTSLPPGLWELQCLRFLNASYNKLSSLPPEISRLTKLRQLGVYSNKLTSLPPEISQLASLTCLHVDNNGLTYLPAEISGLTNLIELRTQSCPIEELPLQLTALTNLKTLIIRSGSGIVSIKRAPRGITNLPCWNNKSEMYGGLSIAGALRNLQLYDLITPDPTSAPITGKYADVMTVGAERVQMVGEGGHGTAYKVQLNKGIVAVKVLKKKAMPGTPEYEELTKEAKVMTYLQHTNIIALYAYGCRNLEILYVMEYADGKSVWDNIMALGALPFDRYIQYSIDVNEGLKYLHSQSPPVEHRDLKPENVLISQNVAKISDFGISSAREAISRTTGFKGTYHYAAPEYFDPMKSYGPTGDIYSYALFIWAMVEGKRPYEGLSLGQIMAQKLHQGPLTIPATTPAKLAALMKECWNTNPRNRPTAESIQPRLADILKNPGAATAEKSKSVKDMDAAELVEFLRGKNINPEFISIISTKKYTGEYFLDLQEGDLLFAPFNFRKVQAKVIADFIEDTKHT